MLEGVTHTFVQQCSLQPSPSQLRNRCRSPKQCNTFMDAQGAGGSWFAIKTCQETITLFPCRRDCSQIQQKLAEFRMLMRPPSRTHFTPQLRFVRPAHLHSDVRVGLCA